MKHGILLTPLVVVFVAAAPALGPEQTVKEAAESYAAMHRMTAEAHPVAPGVMLLCRGPAKSLVDKHGPHLGGWLHVFMNDAARRSFEKGEAYAVGSVIVKEKNQTMDPKGPALNSLGGMVKRKASTPADITDWEFFYVNESKKFTLAADLRSCADCHANAAKKDFVFGDWAKAAETPVKTP